MFGFVKKKNMNLDVSSVDLTKSNDLQTFTPRYEYTIKIFEEDGNGKPITTIQKGIKANSDAELKDLYEMCQQKIQILEKREINPSAAPLIEELYKQPNTLQPQQQSTSQYQAQSQSISAVQPVVKYFSAGGLDFKMVGQDVYQKQWIRATEKECEDIRIVSDSTNKIVALTDKHIELQRWVKVEDSTDSL